MAERDHLFGRRVGEFVIGEVLDEGGYAKVYRCDQPILGREVIIKVLHARLRVDDVQRQRFLREAQLASKLDHPLAAHIYAFNVEPDGLLWIAMECVHGTPLNHWLRDHGPMPLEQLVPFFEHIAEVVQNAHERGIVHRDLKPSNIMVTERAGRLYPKLLDFGVAKLLDGETLPESTPDTLQRIREITANRMRALAVEHMPAEVLDQLREGPSTVTGDSSSPDGGRLTPEDATIGTPGYMAPEQWNRQFPVGPAADLYALGVVAFEGLTGSRPSDGMSEVGTVPRLGGRFPLALDQVFQRALAWNPEDRFATVRELAGALRQASGIGAVRSDLPGPDLPGPDLPRPDLPRIEEDVRDAWLAMAPQPLAESVALLDGARNAHQAHIATQELARDLLRYLLVVTLAMRAKAREAQDDPALLDLVRALDRRALSTEERVRLLRLLVRPLISRRSAPAPAILAELIDLVTPGPDGADGLDPILTLHAAGDHAGAEDVVQARLGRVIPEMTQLLRKTTLVLDYVLVVSRDDEAECWAGARRPLRTPITVVGGEVVEAHPMLVARDGQQLCVDLWPLVQVAPPADGAEEELFVFDGCDGHGAVLTATPSGLAHHDAKVREWLVAHVIAEVEAQARMRDQIRVAAKQWQNRGQPDVLLWRGEVLADFERWTRHTTGAAPLGDLEESFIAASRRVARRVRWTWRVAVAMVLVGVVALVEYRANSRASIAELKANVAEQVATQAKVEQGRQALFNDNLDEAQRLLSEAYQRGDHSPAVAFMRARALQPLLAEKARFATVAGPMWYAAFSPDGRQVVTTDDECARIWDARTHQLTFTLPHGDAVYDARYSSDGARLVTASGDGAVRIWSASTGALLHTLKRQRADGKPSRYFVLALSSDDRLVAAIETTGRVAHVWDAMSGAPLAELSNDGSSFPSIAFSADARWLATSGGDDARVFDTHTWARAFKITGPRIGALSFDPTGPRLVTGSASGDATIWEVPSGARVKRLREVGDPINAAAFSPDGQFIATGGGDGAAQIWDARSGALRNQITTAHTKILSIEFDSPSNLVVAAGDGGAVIVAETLGIPITVFDVAQGIVRTAHFDPTSQFIVGASSDGTARLWDATSPYRKWSSPPIADDCSLMGSIEPEGRFLAIECRDFGTRVWDTARNQMLAELPSMTSVDRNINSVVPVVNAGGDRAAIARGNAVEIYQLPGRQLLRTIQHSAPVSAVAFGPAGHDLVSGAIDGSLLVTRDNLAPIALSASSGGVDVAAILPDGRVVTTDAHSRLRFYDPDRNTLLVEFEIPTRVRMLRLSPDGVYLITIPSHTGKVAPPILWELAHYRRIAQLDAHTGRVFSASFTVSGVLTVGGDGAARLWDRDTGRLLQTYRSTSRFLADAVVDLDQALLIAVGSDGLLWFWDLPTGRPLWKLQAHRSHAIGIHIEGNALITHGSKGEISRWEISRLERVIQEMHTQ